MIGSIYNIICLGYVKFLPLLAVTTNGEGEHEGSTHLPDLIGLLTGTGNDPASLWTVWKPIIFAFAIAAMFSIVAVQVYRKRELIPGPFQNAIEILVEGMYNFIYSVLGKDAKKYTPFLGTLFFYILAMNFMGIIPLGMAPSTNILMFPMHIIGELAKPFSLALRLFGNITGEDILVAAFVGLGLSALSFIGSPVGLPLNVPFILLGILLSTIQALVFTLLSTVYILMMLPHEEH